MALIRSLDPERFNAETLARMFYNGIEYGQCEVSDFQDLIDAMVAEGILVADDPRMLFTCEECGLVSARSSVHMCRPNKGSDIRGQIVP